MESFGYPLYLKCEAFNFAGSVKLKAAQSMVEAAEHSGKLTHGSTIVESTSGNLGLALSVIAAAKGYGFVCVVDARTNLTTRQMIEALGGVIHLISEPDAEGGFLGARLNHVRSLCAANPSYVWLNQHGNENNWLAHYRTTGPAIDAQFPDLQTLFIGAGTTGTLMGCARYFKDKGHPVSVVAIDSIGSVTFGGEPGTRMIPGLGTGIRPDVLDESYVDDVEMVAEADAVLICRRLARKGFMFGGSTGTVIAGALQWLDRRGASEAATTVAISPDLGERYLDTVYQDRWVTDIYGERILSSKGWCDAVPGAPVA